VSVWRHLTAGGLSKARLRLKEGAKILNKHRDCGNGWRRFPFYYTLLALSEMPGKTVVEELRYTAPRLERMLKRRGRGNQSEVRRRAIAERILARI